MCYNTVTLLNQANGAAGVYTYTQLMNKSKLMRGLPHSALELLEARTHRLHNHNEGKRCATTKSLSLCHIYTWIPEVTVMSKSLLLEGLLYLRDSSSF